MNTYSDTLNKAIEKKGCSLQEVALKVGIKEGRLQAVLQGEKQATLHELAAITTYLSLDLNEVLNIKDVNNAYMLLDDELQIKLNSITRTIQKESQTDFIKAVEYLAECFAIKEKQQKK